MSNSPDFRFTNHGVHIGIKLGGPLFSGRRVVLPTPEFFPDAYDTSKKSIHKLLNRVCEYMDVVPDLIEQKFVPMPAKFG